MRLINILLGIWAYLPLFALTDDKQFLAAKYKQEAEQKSEPEKEAEQEPKQEPKHRYYFSLISILFGEMKIQFFSIPIKQSGKKFSIFRIVRLSEMENFMLPDKKAEELEKNYKIHFSSLEEKEQDIEKEALMQHLAEEKSRIETSYNKINAFTTIIVAVIPIAITFVDRNTIKTLGILGWIVFAILIYANVNLCAWIFQAINVRSFMTSSFGDLKDSKEKKKEYNWQIYYDWQQMKRKADMYVSFVKYTKVWIIAVIIFTIVFSVGLPFSKGEISDINENSVYTLQAELIEMPYENSAVSWNLLLADINTDKYKKIFILHNEADIDKIKEKLQPFNHQKIVWLVDRALKEDEIKIILEK